MIQEYIRREILDRIARAEQEHDVKVVYAIESGSRAWGFASPNSDYDVRFIYVHPRDWYLSIDVEERRDVIEYDIVEDIDINGWDARKALRLLRNSNPAIVEWLQSSIVYVDDHYFAEQTRALLPDVYSIARGIYHYRSMAKSSYREHLTQATVSIKKYFYVLRPLLAIRWLQHYRHPAPIEFQKLRAMIADDKPLNAEISKLLQRKKRSLEKEKAPQIPALNDLIEAELERLESFSETPENNTKKLGSLDKLFINLLRRLDGPHKGYD